MSIPSNKMATFPHKKQNGTYSIPTPVPGSRDPQLCVPTGQRAMAKLDE